MTEQLHSLDVRIGSITVERWNDYSIDHDMLEPADSFRLTLDAATIDHYLLAPPDTYVEIVLDDVTILSGYTDERKWHAAREEKSLVITGRDKGGRLVDESMPLGDLAGLGIQDLAERVVGIGNLDTPWFDRVLLSNAENRALVRGGRRPTGKAKLTKVISEPKFEKKVRSELRVHPGQTRWQTLRNFLDECELMAWAAADGRALIIGEPNYDQEPQYSFFAPAPKSVRSSEGNILEYDLSDSVAERYSALITVGAGRADDDDDGPSVTQHRFEVKNGTGRYGVGGDFTFPKVLIFADDDCRTQELTEKRARREMAVRDASSLSIELTVQGHGQAPDRFSPTTLYAFDTIAHVEIEELGVTGLYLVTGLTFQHNREQGETTKLKLVPKGTVLRQ